jgi:phage host-nuclease inhibitor protein Gam
MARAKTVQVPVPAENELPGLMQEYTKAEKELEEIAVRKEKKLQNIRALYLEKETELQYKMQEQFKKLEAFANANKEGFSKKRSKSLGSGVIGFRLGQRAVKTKKGWTFKKSLEAMGKNLNLSQFIQRKPEIDKPAILKEKIEVELPDGSLNPLYESLAECGLEIRQDETFFVETASEKSLEVAK